MNSKVSEYMTQYGTKTGIKEWGELLFPRDLALRLIQVIREENLLISGGDVIYKDPSLKSECPFFYPSNDNWYTEPLPEDSLQDYKKRSWEITERYIKNYKTSRVPENQIYFVIVISDRWPENEIENQ